MRRTALVLFVVLLIFGGTAPALLGGKGKPAPAGCTVPSWCTGCIAVKATISGNITSNEFCGMIQEGNFQLGPTDLLFSGLETAPSPPSSPQTIVGIAMGSSSVPVQDLGFDETTCKGMTYVWKDDVNPKIEYQLMFHNLKENTSITKTSSVVVRCDAEDIDGCTAWTVWPNKPSENPDEVCAGPQDSKGALWTWTSAKNPNNGGYNYLGLYPLPHTITVTRVP